MSSRRREIGARLFRGRRPSRRTWRRGRRGRAAFDDVVPSAAAGGRSIRSIGIAVRRWRRQTEAADFGQPTASATRWRVSTLPSTPLPVPGVGRARWLLELIRCRAGESADFVVDACDARVVSLYLPNWPTDRLRRKLGAARLMRRAAGAGRPSRTTARGRARRTPPRQPGFTSECPPPRRRHW